MKRYGLPRCVGLSHCNFNYHKPGLRGRPAHRHSMEEVPVSFWVIWQKTSHLLLLLFFALMGEG